MGRSPYLEDRLRDVPTESAQDIGVYFDRLWPILRSITGEGVRQTHDILGELLPLERIEIPSGEPVFDWTIPDEWRVGEAWVEGPDGSRVVDVADSTLHLLNYSSGFQGKVSLDELDKHLYSLPDLPGAIPYVTSYYQRRWGFCLSHELRQSLEEGDYTVHIDAEHVSGSMTLSHVVLPGASDREILFSSYTCHPSMGNNELSGPLVLAYLYRRLAALKERRYTYRFVLCPETIGAIAYLARYGEHLRSHVDGGLVLSCIGDPGGFTLKRSRRGDSLMDKAAGYVMENGCRESKQLDYWPGGSDERQYGSPGFNMPVGLLARSIYGGYEEYHTSLDNREFISFDAMRESVDTCFAVVDVLENTRVYERTNPFCEPFLSKYELHDTVGASRQKGEEKIALQWLLNLADGEHDLLEIARRSGCDFWLLAETAERLVDAGLIREI